MQVARPAGTLADFRKRKSAASLQVALGSFPSVIFCVCTAMLRALYHSAAPVTCLPFSHLLVPENRRLQQVPACMRRMHTDLACVCNQDQVKALRRHVSQAALEPRPLGRSLSVEESGRSSATLGESAASQWQGQQLGISEDDGDSPASMVFAMPHGAQLRITLFLLMSA